MVPRPAQLASAGTCVKMQVPRPHPTPDLPGQTLRSGAQCSGFSRALRCDAGWGLGTTALVSWLLPTSPSSCSALLLSDYTPANGASFHFLELPRSFLLRSYTGCPRCRDMVPVSVLILRSWPLTTLSNVGFGLCL